MTTIKIGGVTGLLVNRTASNGFSKARAGDTVKLLGLSTRLLDGISITEDLFIESKSSNIVITDQHKNGFLIGTTNNVSFENVSFDVAVQSNAIATEQNYVGDITLNHVETSSRKAKLQREYYPHIIINGGNEITIDHCNIKSLAIDAPNGVVNITHSILGTEFQADSQISAAEINISDTTLQNIGIQSPNLTMANIITNGDVTVGGNVSITNIETNYIAPKLVPRKYEDPVIMLGTFPDTEAMIENMHITQVPEEAYATKNPLTYHALYIDNSTMIFKNSKLINLTKESYAKDSSITAIDSQIADTWLQEGNVVFNQQNSVTNGGDENDAVHKLEQMTGLTEAKKQMKSLINTAGLNKIREDKGLPVPDDFSLHMIFQGNAGTGKTTVARIYGQALFERGVLPTNNFIETKAKDLVAGYVRQTAEKTQAVIDKAIGGVLFIDEAYSLIPHGDNDFSQEAIETLLAEIENRRSEFVVILAGYTKDINELIKTNQGLASRIPNRVTFEDYTPKEILDIIFGNFQKNNLHVRKDDLAEVAPQLYSEFLSTGADVGNARWARNFTQAVIMAQNTRLSNETDVEDLSETALSTITMDDIINGSNQMIDNFNAQEDMGE